METAGRFLFMSEKVRLFDEDEVMRDGFDLICIEHGIYGRVARGDRCGPCEHRVAGFS